MKICKICLVGMGLLLILVSCSSGEVEKADTEAFLSGLTTMVGEAMIDESTQLISDFQASSPPGPTISNYTEILGTASNEKLRNPEPFGIDTLYGTWDYRNFEWEHIDLDDPENAILFTWDYTDTAGHDHDAYIRVDSLGFYEDSLPTDIWAGIGMDNELLAWLKLEAEYNSLDEVNEVSLIYEVVDYMQVGISMTSDAAIDTSFTGTVSLWVIDRTSNDYRVDLDITVADDYPEEIELSDSDGWDMDLEISEVVESEAEYERRNVSGDITKSGGHAADIDGYIWEPDDGGEHTSVITITFSDDTEGNLEDYLAVVGDLPEF
jgi:hypothetical protein